MLACNANLDKLKYPVRASIKYDGVRCIIKDGVAYSRAMKPIPNEHIQNVLRSLDLDGYEGELVLNGESSFSDVQSAVMSVDGEPDFKLMIFDNYRLDDIAKIRHIMIQLNITPDESINHVDQTTIENEEELLSFYDIAIGNGHEGIILRNPEAKYKFGRATENSQELMRMKPKDTTEAVVVEIIEKMKNNNEAKRNELGYKTRSSCKANLEPAGTAGAILVEKDGLQFKLGFGKGFDDENKKRVWNEKEELVGCLVTYEYQDLGSNGAPRHPKAIGFRHEFDMS